MFSILNRPNPSNLTSVRLNDTEDQLHVSFQDRNDGSAVNDDDFMSRENSEDMDVEPTDSRRSSS